jgi:hypothetical protein
VKRATRHTTIGCSHPLQKLLLLQLRRKPAVDRRSYFGHQGIAFPEIGGLYGIVKLHCHCSWTNREARFWHDGFGA